MCACGMPVCCGMRPAVILWFRIFQSRTGDNGDKKISALSEGWACSFVDSINHSNSKFHLFVANVCHLPIYDVRLQRILFGLSENIEKFAEKLKMRFFYIHGVRWLSLMEWEKSWRKQCTRRMEKEVGVCIVCSTILMQLYLSICTPACVYV